MHAAEKPNYPSECKLKKFSQNLEGKQKLVTAKDKTRGADSGSQKR